jgi:DNA-binding NtrC family response regulator
MPKPMKKKKKTRLKVPKKPAIKSHLLVVDDEADFARMIQQALIKEGYRVDAAVSATQAMALMRKHSYDLALVDMRMPEMTGLELLQYLKMKDKKISVMIMTAFGTVSIGYEALKKGACDYLAKPFKLELLRRKVSEELKRRVQYLEEQRILPQRSAMDEL